MLLDGLRQLYPACGSVDQPTKHDRFVRYGLRYDPCLACFLATTMWYGVKLLNSVDSLHFSFCCETPCALRCTHRRLERADGKTRASSAAPLSGGSSERLANKRKMPSSSESSESAVDFCLLPWASNLPHAPLVSAPPPPPTLCPTSNDRPLIDDSDS